MVWNGSGNTNKDARLGMHISGKETYSELFVMAVLVTVIA